MDTNGVFFLPTSAESWGKFSNRLIGKMFPFCYLASQSEMTAMFNTASDVIYI